MDFLFASSQKVMTIEIGHDHKVNAHDPKPELKRVEKIILTELVTFSIFTLSAALFPEYYI